MPLPLIPVLLGGAALAAGAFGAKKAYDGYQTSQEVEDLREEAERKQRYAKREQEELDSKRQITNDAMERLGELKIYSYELLGRFVEVYQKIQNIDYNASINRNMSIPADYQEIIEIRDHSLKILEIAGGGIASLGSGVLAGIGACGAVKFLGVASTGTAISTLGGAAATNATLAWLGGGALSAGGLGIAGGTAVLGGIVAAPVLAVAGWMYAAKAEANKANVEASLKEIKAARQAISSAMVVLKGIEERVSETRGILNQLNPLLTTKTKELSQVVAREVDFRRYNSKEQEITMQTASIAITLKNICDAPVIDENGEVHQQSMEVLNTARNMLSELRLV